MDTLAQIEGRPLLLFDGVCNLCNGMVNFVIDRDLKKQVLFASLQSEIGQQLSRQYELPMQEFESMVLLVDEKIYLKSDAALELSRYLSGGWSLLYIFKAIPRIVRDPIYHIISSNRYRWFGKKDQCRMPAPQLKNRFLSV